MTPDKCTCSFNVVKSVNDGTIELGTHHLHTPAHDIYHSSYYHVLCCHCGKSWIMKYMVGETVMLTSKFSIKGHGCGEYVQ